MIAVNPHEASNTAAVLVQISGFLGAPGTPTSEAGPDC